MFPSVMSVYELAFRPLLNVISAVSPQYIPFPDHFGLWAFVTCKIRPGCRRSEKTETSSLLLSSHVPSPIQPPAAVVPPVTWAP